MGVPWRLVLYIPDKQIANRAAGAAFERIKKLNSIFSDYDAESEVRRLTAKAQISRPVEISPDLHYVLAKSLQFSRETEGAFDVTVGPLVRLWRRARRRKEMPSETRIAEARLLTGYRSISLNSCPQTVAFAKLGVELDFGGIAKGYAADEALAVLNSYGITSAMIDGGGDLVVGDPPPGKDSWRIGIAAWDDPDRTVEQSVSLCNGAIATSGDAYQFVEIDGVRYSHLVDPRTGLGITPSRTVTVIAANGLRADAIASAVSVMGPEAGIRYLDRQCDTSGLVVELVDGKPRYYSSARFDQYRLRP